MKHYVRPTDIEWARDVDDGKLYLVPARPETVSSKVMVGVIDDHEMLEAGRDVLVEGRAVGRRIGSGRANVLKSMDEKSTLNEGQFLAADMIGPNWEPIMNESGAVVADSGGRTCHAAITARVRGAIAVSCAEGGAICIHEGLLKFGRSERDFGEVPRSSCRS